MDQETHNVDENDNMEDVDNIIGKASSNLGQLMLSINHWSEAERSEDDGDECPIGCQTQQKVDQHLEKFFAMRQVFAEHRGDDRDDDTSTSGTSTAATATVVSELTEGRTCDSRETMDYVGGEEVWSNEAPSTSRLSIRSQESERPASSASFTTTAITEESNPPVSEDTEVTVDFGGRETTETESLSTTSGLSERPSSASSTPTEEVSVLVSEETDITAKTPESIQDFGDRETRETRSSSRLTTRPELSDRSASSASSITTGFAETVEEHVSEETETLESIQYFGDRETTETGSPSRLSIGSGPSERSASPALSTTTGRTDEVSIFVSEEIDVTAKTPEFIQDFGDRDTTEIESPSRLSIRSELNDRSASPAFSTTTGYGETNKVPVNEKTETPECMQHFRDRETRSTSRLSTRSGPSERSASSALSTTRFTSKVLVSEDTEKTVETPDTTVITDLQEEEVFFIHTWTSPPTSIWSERSERPLSSATAVATVDYIRGEEVLIADMRSTSRCSIRSQVSERPASSASPTTTTSTETVKILEETLNDDALRTWQSTEVDVDGEEEEESISAPCIIFEESGKKPNSSERSTPKVKKAFTPEINTATPEPLQSTSKTSEDKEEISNTQRDSPLRLFTTLKRSRKSSSSGAATPPVCKEAKMLEFDMTEQADASRHDEAKAKKDLIHKIKRTWKKALGKCRTNIGPQVSSDQQRLFSESFCSVSSEYEEEYAVNDKGADQQHLDPSAISALIKKLFQTLTKTEWKELSEGVYDPDVRERLINASCELLKLISDLALKIFLQSINQPPHTSGTINYMRFRSSEQFFSDKIQDESSLSKGLCNGQDVPVKISPDFTETILTAIRDEVNSVVLEESENLMDEESVNAAAPVSTQESRKRAAQRMLTGVITTLTYSLTGLRTDIKRGILESSETVSEQETQAEEQTKKKNVCLPKTCFGIAKCSKHQTSPLEEEAKLRIAPKSKHTSCLPSGCCWSFFCNTLPDETELETSTMTKLVEEKKRKMVWTKQTKQTVPTTTTKQTTSTGSTKPTTPTKQTTSTGSTKSSEQPKQKNFLE